MKALRFGQNHLQLADINTPAERGEALVRVSLAGICNTDLEITRGYANFNGTLGHEFVGLVEDSPDRSQIGRRVVGEINVGCGHCERCRRQDPRHCPERAVLGIRRRDGAFAEYLQLPPRNLLIVPDAVSDRQAVFAEPLAAACEILDQVTIDPSHRVAIIGDGKLGQLISRVLATTGCDPVLIGKHLDKLNLAAEAGITTLELKRLQASPPGRFDFVVEASGTPGGLQLALDLVRPQGTIILKSTFPGPAQLDTSRVVVNELNILGSRCGRFEPALKLLETRRVEVEPLISAEFELSEGLAAIQEAQKPGTLKVLLKV
ncbi:MAG TPA: alcohol dehydrogenase catalytic domain-containing protein [Blastocatellia bacterium]|nr:alcohol dehydrogenase catalytic domain-containing protein [Blastocatellia bacterium]